MLQVKNFSVLQLLADLGGTCSIDGSSRLRRHVLYIALNGQYFGGSRRVAGNRYGLLEVPDALGIVLNLDGRLLARSDGCFGPDGHRAAA